MTMERRTILLPDDLIDQSSSSKIVNSLWIGLQFHESALDMALRILRLRLLRLRLLRVRILRARILRARLLRTRILRARLLRARI